jgi:apolipoprotein D and lipocalin family protein
MGIWYEITKFPQRFEKGVVGITAKYTLLSDGKVRVLNRGYKGDLNGEMRTIKGKAWVVDIQNEGQIEGDLLLAFRGGLLDTRSW